MEDLSLHILDIAENSLRAGASNVEIRLVEKKNNVLIFMLEDDGKGMDEETSKNAMNPFFTTKDSKKFGLGLPLLSQAAEMTGGNMRIEKKVDKGTRIIAKFYMDHIDMIPLGDIQSTMRVLKYSHPEVHFSFEHIKDGGSA